MARNRHIKLARKLERAQIVHQEETLGALDGGRGTQNENLHGAPVVNRDKVRRSLRIEQKCRYKSKRRQNTNENRR